ncbi:protein kinase domain-containing protein [Candidatus Viridilinea mediisalina]|uniref:Protein kinase domain-containing protein n=1 Tax=Candidatus Viridilinea mediisalina TaxID=2024553 RepID=A0A2A6RJB8_9CHLR|nr:protein kinase [Candidatus Viridilinea mediisalina]PDW02940.1 hypothetical protein CJ255_11490 [Candidatus Viridilinea mediisalina]
MKFSNLQSTIWNLPSKTGCPLARTTQLGGFELLALLGRGGQGAVYLGRPWDARLVQRRVVARWLRGRWRRGELNAVDAARWRLAAIKVAHPDATAALHDEHSHLMGPHATHPHLACLYRRRYPHALRDIGLGTVAGQPCLYLALAYEAGLPLNQWLAHQPRPSDATWALRLGLQLASALSHLHARGLVHHDVRPANLIVRRTVQGQPDVVLLDLGAVESLDRPRRHGVYGVAHCLPPERRGPQPGPVTPYVDIYALGRLLQLLTAGRPLRPSLAKLINATAQPGAVATMALLHEYLYTEVRMS